MKSKKRNKKNYVKKDTIKKLNKKTIKSKKFKGMCYRPSVMAGSTWLTGTGEKVRRLERTTWEGVGFMTEEERRAQEEAARLDDEAIMAEIQAEQMREQALAAEMAAMMVSPVTNPREWRTATRSARIRGAEARLAEARAAEERERNSDGIETLAYIYAVNNRIRAANDLMRIRLMRGYV